MARPPWMLPLGFLLLAAGKEYRPAGAGAPYERKAKDGKVKKSQAMKPLEPERLRALHGKLDTNGDGRVSLHELEWYAKTVDMDTIKKEAREMLEELDANNDGKMTLEEHLAFIPDEAELETKKFKAADRNGDGFLTSEELPPLIYPELHEPVLEAIVRANWMVKDKDGDGKLNLDEFKAEDNRNEEEERVENTLNMLVGKTDDMQKEFLRLDKDSDGKLTFEEVKLTEMRSRDDVEGSVARQLRDVFHLCDEDSDQHVSADELVSAGSDTDHGKQNSLQQLRDWIKHEEL